MTKAQAIRITRIGLGVILLPLGVAGLFLPFLQGILFLVLAALLLSVDMPFFRRLVHKVEGKSRRLHRWLERGRGWARRKGWVNDHEYQKMRPHWCRGSDYPRGTANPNINWN